MKPVWIGNTAIGSLCTIVHCTWYIVFGFNCMYVLVFCVQFDINHSNLCSVFNCIFYTVNLCLVYNCLFNTYICIHYIIVCSILQLVFNVQLCVLHRNLFGLNT